MRKIEKRSVFCLILAALLGIGLAFFCFRFVADGDDWASYPYNRHLYNNQGVLKGGTIIDSRGVVLSTLSEDGERVYNEDGTIRRATLHAVGDPAGNIGAGALTAFADKLSGYNLLTGAYSPLGTGNSVYLTIDSELNRVAYEALGGQSGTVGVYNYKTGEILCMVSAPTFDPADPPNIAADDPAWDGVYVNRLLSANSIPGSIFKVVTLNAAIENIPDLFQRKWTCTGSVNIGGEEAKSGFAPESLEQAAEEAKKCANVRVRGLMCIPPVAEGEHGSLPYFEKVHALFVDINAKLYDNTLDILSMGMSGDYEDAVRCGATMVRVGTAIFGARNYTI